MATRPSVMPAASMPVTTTAMACVRCTSTRWKGCGHYYAPGSALIAASPKRSSPCISASSSSFTTPADAARPCSAPWSSRWSRDHATTLDPDKSLKRYAAVIAHWRTHKLYLAMAVGFALLVFGGIGYSLCEPRAPEHDWELFKKV